MNEDQMKADYEEHVSLIAMQDKIHLADARMRAWLEGHSGLAERKEREKYRLASRRATQAARDRAAKRRASAD